MRSTLTTVHSLFFSLMSIMITFLPITVMNSHRLSASSFRSLMPVETSQCPAHPLVFLLFWQHAHSSHHLSIHHYQYSDNVLTDSILICAPKMRVMPDEYVMVSEAITRCLDGRSSVEIVHLVRRISCASIYRKLLIRCYIKGCFLD